MANISYHKSSRPNLSHAVTASGKRRKKSGCGVVLLGCFSILILVSMMLSAVGLYLYYMDKEEMIGAIAIGLIKDQNVDINFSGTINDNPTINVEDKLVLKISYEKFLSEYDSMPEHLQIELKKNIGRLVKKVFSNPELLQSGQVPEELKNIVRLIMPNQKFFENKDDLDFPEQKIWYKLIEESKQASFVPSSKPKSTHSNWRRSRRYRRY